MNRPNHIYEKHWQEWLDSCVDPEIIALNVRSLSGAEALNYLLYSDKLKRRNDGRLRDRDLERYKHCEKGGFWIEGVCLPGGVPEWGAFKPDRPRTTGDVGNKKILKYEHPPKESTGVFALKSPLHVWEKIADRAGVAMPTIIELLNFWQWVIEHPEVPVVITEGAKKAGALLTAGYAAIGLPGIFNGYRQPKNEEGEAIGMPHLIPELESLAVAGRSIYFAFDNDSKVTTRTNVKIAISKTAKLLTQKGCKSFVVDWSSFREKGCDDLIANKGVNTFHKAYQHASHLLIWLAKQYSSLSYKADLIVNQRYLGELSIPELVKLICIKSPKGTGKTESLAGVVDIAIRAGQPILILTHRRQLGKALCERFGVNYVEEIKDSETGRLLGYGLCVDSLHSKSLARFNPEGWGDALVIIDECEQVFWHLLNASTEVKKNRVAVLRNLKILIQKVLEGKGKIFLSDADLSDVSIDYVRALAGFPVTPWLLVNEYKDVEPRAVYIYSGTDPSELVADLVIDIEQGGKPFVCCSAQKVKSKWGTRNLEAYLQQQFPERRILRIDSESVADPNHPAYGCIGNLNEILAQYDIVLASPSVETGVSIDIKGHFTGVWGIAQGVQSANSVRQFLGRVRASIPRYLWAVERGINRIGDGSVSIKSLIASQDRLTAANIRLLIESDCDDSIDSDFQSESLNTWAKFACRQNLDMANYRDAILEGLAHEGYQIIWKDSEEDSQNKSEQIKAEVESIREQKYQQHCEIIAATENPDDTEYQQLQEKRARTEEQLAKFRKGQLARRYEIDISPQLVAKDDAGWYAQIRLHYLLTLGREFVSSRDRKVAEFQLEKGEGALWKPDFNRSQWGAKIRLLEILEIPRLLQSELEFSDRSPILERIGDLARREAWAIKVILGCAINPKDSNIAIAQALLDKCGLKLEYLGRFGGRGNRQRVYGGALVRDERFEIFEKWLERDRLAAKELERQVAVPVSTPANNKYMGDGGTIEGYGREDIEIMADCLQVAADDPEGAETLADLRRCWPARALQAACKLLAVDVREKIKQWVEVQNRQGWEMQIATTS
jgi:hypothetical protein